jgi:competence protein ComEC
MPSPWRSDPALLAVAAFAAGLGLGLHRGVAPVVLLPAVGALALAARVRRRGAFGAGVLLLGAAHGVAARWSDRGSCASHLPAESVRLEILVLEPTTDGILARVRPRVDSCRGAVLARFGPRDTVRAGQRLLVEARWLSRPSVVGPAGGLLAIRSWLPLGYEPGPQDRLRNRLHDSARDLFGARAGLVDALILGRRGAIDPATNAEFARSGLVHILSISGFHVGLIAGWSMLLLRGAGLAQHRARWAATGLVGAYVGFIGAPAPALRATLLLLIGALEAARQRSVRPGPLFAVTALALLVLDPMAVADLGAWLSVTALWGATTVVRWGERAVSRRAVSRLLFGSIGATVGTLPLAGLALGVVAPVGVLANLIAIPVADLAVPAVLVSLALRWVWEGAARSLAEGGRLLLDLLERLSALGADLPGGALVFEPGLVPAVIGVAVVAVAAWLLGRRNTAGEAGRRLAWAGAVALLAHLAWIGWRRSDAGTRLTLHFLDVGQGDAALVRTPRGRWIAVDAGPKSASHDAGQRVVAPFLVREGAAALEAMIVSHAHLDHLGGAPAVLAQVPTRVVLEPGRPTPDSTYRGFLDAVDRAGARWGTLRAGTRFSIDGVEFAVLHPDTAWAEWGEDLNEDSIVLLIRAGRFEALLGGDAGFPVEERLRGRVGQVELLKVGHHGSRTATGDRWLAELAPRAAVISSGWNRYGHPAPETLERLAASRVDVWRTDRDGRVTVAVDDWTMRVRGRNGERRYPLR